MIRVEVIKKFTLEKFDLLKNVIRKNKQNDEKGTLYIGDTFECDDKMLNYLTGNNAESKTVVKVIEIKSYEAKVVDADKVEVKVIVDEKKVKEEVINTKKTKKKNSKNIKK